MKIAVFGGSGFVGSHIVDALVAAGHRPSLLVRSGSEQKVMQPEHCDIVPGDLDSPDAIDATLRDCDAALYLVGILREFPRRGITFEQTQYEGVISVIGAAERLGVRRLLLMSANGVAEQRTKYQQTKYRAEQAALRSGLDVTVLRPSVIFGNPRGRMEFATQLFRDVVDTPFPAIGFRRGFLPGAGGVEMSPVHIDDVADAFVGALHDSETIGRVLVLGGPECLTWTEMVRRVAAAVGRHKLILPMPIAVMRIPAALLDWLPMFPVTRDQLTMLEQGNVADPKDLCELIGRTPRPFDTASLSYLRD